MRFLCNVLQFAGIVSIFVVVGDVVPRNVFDIYSWVAHVFLCFSLSMWILELIHDYFFKAKVGTKNKAVLITGCDTGFGHAMAKLFDRRGYQVFACCLDESSDGAMELKEVCSKKLSVIQMDVTNDGSVTKAVKIVENNSGKSELWAIINNAGVLKGFQTELSKMSDYEMCMQVNSLGMVRVTKAFLPFLRKSKGRVVNVCSIAGRLRSPLMSAYMMSKSAAVAFTEVLNQEMRDFGVRVISIEPEFFKTPMCSEEYVSNFLRESCSNIDEEIKSSYGKDYIEKCKMVYYSVFSKNSPDVKQVYNAIESAVSLQNPADIYRPARNIFVKITCMAAERVPRVFAEQAVMVMFFLMGLPTPKTGASLVSRFLNM